MSIVAEFKTSVPVQTGVEKKKSLRKNVVAYLFISPWLLGFLGFVLGPMLASLYLSFTDYDMLSSPKWVGFQNYVEMFPNDPRFWNSMKITLSLFLFPFH